MTEQQPEWQDDDDSDATQPNGPTNPRPASQRRAAQEPEDFEEMPELLVAERPRPGGCSTFLLLLTASILIVSVYAAIRYIDSKFSSFNSGEVRPVSASGDLGPTPTPEMSTPELSPVPTDMATVIAASAATAEAPEPPRQEFVLIIVTPLPPVETMISEQIQETAVPTVLPSPSVTPVPVCIIPAPVSKSPIIGSHRVMPGETVYCIARTYGVSPYVIVEQNNLQPSALVHNGLYLDIPAAPWTFVPAGEACVPQFVSPYWVSSCAASVAGCCSDE
jgi:hypothetical protein